MFSLAVLKPNEGLFMVTPRKKLGRVDSIFKHESVIRVFMLF